MPIRALAQTLRLWARQPLFLLTTIAVLAIGLGANLTIFAIVNGLLLRPITPDHAERLVAIYSRDTTQVDGYRAFSYPNYVDVAAAKAVFANVLAHGPSMVGITEGDVTRRAFADFVSANFFATLGTPLARGRAFSEAESAPGADIAAAIISDALFNRLGRPEDVLDRTLRVNGRDYAIVGVTPPSFTGTTAVASPELWLPLGVFERGAAEMRAGGGRQLADRTNHSLFLIGRLNPGLSLADANRALHELGNRMSADQPDVNAHQELLARPAPRTSISTRPPNEAGVGIAAALLLAVATVVLVIACLNVATLLLSRGMARRREIAVRLALGATRGRIVRQLLLEGLSVAAIACTVGIALAYRASTFLAATIQAIAPLPVVFSARPDGRTLAAAAAWTAVSTVMFALGPAWKLTRADVMDDLQRRPMFASAGSWRRWASGPNLMVVAQIALSLVLLTTAGLFLRGAARSMSAPLGFAIDGEVVAAIDPALGGYDTTRARELDLAALYRVRAMASVRSASLASTIPFGDTREGASLSAAPTTRRDETLSAGFVIVGHDYFRTLEIPVIAGREFSQAEERGLPAGRIAVIDQLAAQRLWPGADPIGRTVYRTIRGGEPQPLTVIGVVAPTRLDVIDEPAPVLYVPFGQEPRSTVAVHARVEPGAEASALPALRTALVSVDPRLPILKLSTMRTVREESPSTWMLTTSGRIFGSLGFLAALLAVTGLYAVIAYLVSRRVKEIGIRMALGAERRDVLLMVVRDGLVLTAAGLALGIGFSAAAAQVVRSAASAIAVVDATVFVVPPVLLLTAALIASAIPARRAAGLPPIVALREE